MEVQIIKNNNKLTSYFAGAMESVSDQGLSWRQKYKKILTQLLDINCVLPNDYDRDLIANYEEFKKLKKEDFEGFKIVMKTIINVDLASVYNSDFIIIKWDGELMCGTYGEAQAAFLKDIPVYLVTSVKQENIPSWFLGCITKLFVTDIDLFEYLIDQYPEFLMSVNNL